MKPTLLRKGDWFTLVSGKHFWPLDPRAEEIEITDIAHALAHIFRWGGHCRRFYSVAQHSVLVSKFGTTLEERRWGLLHDAAEAYIGDMIRPIKHSMPEFQEAERRLIGMIGERFGLTYPWPERVDEADDILLATEAVALMHPITMDSPLIRARASREIKIEYWPPVEAKTRFLQAFTDLFLEQKEKTDGEE